MQEYIVRVILVYCFVDFLLFLGINKLFGYGYSWCRMILATMYGGIFALACLLTKLEILDGFGVRLASMTLIGMLAFGWDRLGRKKCFIYLLLHMLLPGMVHISPERMMPAAGITAGGLLFGYAALFRIAGSRLYIPVELTYCGRKLLLTALRDTGNNLRDPVTGRSVLVIDAVSSEALTGLSRQQLRKPLDTIGAVPGLRLIPYKTVGGTGLLLALQLTDVKIGSRCGNRLVAFSPEVLSVDGMYQALMGRGIK